jgi:hypothetical protein
MPKLDSRFPFLDDKDGMPDGTWAEIFAAGDIKNTL